MFYGLITCIVVSSLTKGLIHQIMRGSVLHVTNPPSEEPSGQAQHRGLLTLALYNSKLGYIYITRGTRVRFPLTAICFSFNGSASSSLSPFVHSNGEERERERERKLPETQHWTTSGENCNCPEQDLNPRPLITSRV